MTDNPFARYVTDANRQQIADTILNAWFNVGNWRDEYSEFAATMEPDIVEAFLAALAIVGPEIRRDALEEAAEECERQKEIFASPRYATALPMASFQERFACSECAAAIRALGKEG